MFESFQSRIVFAGELAACPQMKNADLLDVVAVPCLDEHPARIDLKESYESAVAALSTHSGE
jgi:hypothetical protein